MYQDDYFHDSVDGIDTHLHCSHFPLQARHNQIKTSTVISLLITCPSYTDSPEHVEARVGRADDDSGQLFVPVEFLHVLLSLVYKQELWRYVDVVAARHSVGVTLHSQVPQRHLVIRSRRRKHRAVCVVPLNRGYWRRVVLEHCHRLALLQGEGSRQQQPSLGSTGHLRFTALFHRCRFQVQFCKFKILIN